MSHCQCDQTPCRCVSARSNSLRSDIEHIIRDTLRSGDLEVTQVDGLTTDKIKLLKTLNDIRQDMIASQGPFVVGVPCVPCDQCCDEPCNVEGKCHVDCQPDLLASCAECGPKPCGC